METKKMLAVYTVVQRPEGKDVWLRVGSAFTNRDNSLSVFLDAIPTNGKLHVREYAPREVRATRPHELREVRDERTEGAL